MRHRLTARPSTCQPHFNLLYHAMWADAWGVNHSSLDISCSCPCRRDKRCGTDSSLAPPPANQTVTYSIMRCGLMSE
ncbi:hypothetical protein J6590_018932 [Homalodisca vitripennis]|nr:hypothetical protein J6590_018932 [Homalodisca vitripennis]